MIFLTSPAAFSVRVTPIESAPSPESGIATITVAVQRRYGLDTLSYRKVKPSAPAFPADQTALWTRSRSTASATASIAKSISSPVVNRPRPNRRLARAMSSSRPIARSTWLGSGLAEVHAAPELTATSRIAIIRASPST